MQKKYIYILLLFLFIFTLSGCSFNKSSEENNVETNSAEENLTKEYSTEKTGTNSTNNTIEITKNITSVTEEEISNFSTKIYTKDSNRQNNLSITCNTLNGTEVKPGETFSFCNTVGKATTAKGYKEADVFTADGEVTKV